MPNMISQRSFRLPTTTGHVLLFKANVPLYVPPSAVSAALSAGCIAADGSNVDQLDSMLADGETLQPAVGFVGDVRESLIFLAIQELIKHNKASNFDGSGAPKPEAIGDLLGFDITHPEMVKVYRAHLQANEDDDQYSLHPSAPQALRVIRAESKAELAGIADEVITDEAEAKAAKKQNVRDLRRLLLSKLSGITLG